MSSYLARARPSLVWFVIPWLAAALVVTTSDVAAQGAARIAVVDSARLWAAGGITTWLEARARLDAEHAAGYQPAELPPNAKVRPIKPAPPSTSGYPPSDADRKLRSALRRIEERSQRYALWNAHEAEVLDPIVADVEAALARFARARRIDLLLDASKIDGILYVAPSVDLTAAFIRDYNARTAARARTAPRPAPR